MNGMAESSRVYPAFDSFRDELEDFIEKSKKDPGFAAVWQEVETRHERLQERLCAFGNCVELYDPLDPANPGEGPSEGGWGPVGCPCQGGGDG